MIKESEKAVIGSLIIEPDCLDLVQKHIKSSDYFADKRLGRVFDVVSEMHLNGENIDITTIADKFENQRFVDVLMQITQNTHTTAYVGDYARVVAEMHARRMLKELGKVNPMNTETYPTPLDIITKYEDTLKEVEEVLNRAEDSPASEVIDEVLGDIEKDYANGGNKKLLPTGYIDLDRLILGWEKTENVILAARPAMGKTALALCLARNALQQGQKVLIFSLEMGKKRLMERFLSIEGRVHSEAIKTRRLGKEDFNRITEASSNIGEWNLYIYDDVFNMAEIRSISQRHAAKGDVGLIVIDYLQLIRENKRFNNRHSELGYYAYEIARLAKACNATAITLSQLSRNVDNRDDKRPRLSDLYESGAIEAAADKVIFLYRDEYYHPDDGEKNVAEVCAAKARDGQTGTVALAWMGGYFRFENITRRELDEV